MHTAQRDTLVIEVIASDNNTGDSTRNNNNSNNNNNVTSSEATIQKVVPPCSRFSSSHRLNFSAMKIFNRFRKIIMRLVFSFPSSRSSAAATGVASRHRTSCDKPDPPKTSCSSYYSSHTHYNEAIADCIEFFNKSAHEGFLDGRKSDVMV